MVNDLTNDITKALRVEGVEPYLLFMLGGQLFGIDIDAIQSVEQLDDITPVPLSDGVVSGVSQLHGSIATAIDLRGRLALQGEEVSEDQTSIIVWHKGVAYCFMIDEAIGIFDLDTRNPDRVPDTLNKELRSICTGVLRHENRAVLTTSTEALVGFLDV